MELIAKMLSRTCTAHIENPKDIDHLCVGKVRRIPTFTVGGFKVRLPYCEYHRAWVRGSVVGA